MALLFDQYGRGEADYQKCIGYLSFSCQIIVVLLSQDIDTAKTELDECKKELDKVKKEYDTYLEKFRKVEAVYEDAVAEGQQWNDEFNQLEEEIRRLDRKVHETEVQKLKRNNQREALQAAVECMFHFSTYFGSTAQDKLNS